MAYPVDLEDTYLVEPFGTTQGRSFPHTGDDFARRKTAAGQPVKAYPNVYAAYSGTVISSDWHAQAGNRIVIRYWFGLCGVYAHLHERHVSKNATVRERQKIGLLGGTGKVTGPHLHYSQYTVEFRALSGIVQYWKNQAGRVIWPSVAEWATASGLVRPTYTRKQSGQADTPATGPIVEDDMSAEDVKRLEDKLDWIKEAIGGSNGNRDDQLRIMLGRTGVNAQQAADASQWLRARIGGSNAGGTANITNMLRGIASSEPKVIVDGLLELPTETANAVLDGLSKALADRAK